MECERVTKVILKPEILRIGFLADYDCEIGFVPYHFPYQKAPWESDDRSVSVPKTSGSLWFRIYPTGTNSLVAQATFAADSCVVRCDSIEVAPPHRRKGIANQAYLLAACAFDAPVIPSGEQSELSRLFWQNRTFILWRSSDISLHNCTGSAVIDDEKRKSI